MRGNHEAAEETIMKYHHQFGEDYYPELIRNGLDKKLETAYSDFLINVGKKHGIKVVATNDVHRCYEEDSSKLEKLLGANFGNMAKTIPLPTDDWMKSEMEILSQFSDCPRSNLRHR